MFTNIENKTDLLKMVVPFFTLPEFRRRLETPLITNDKDTTLMITEDSVSTLILCNHEEADSRLVLHATESATEVVVVSKDTYVFVLLVYAYAKLEPSHHWFMKIDTGRFVHIQVVVNNFGTNICLKLPHTDTITGSDTTSFLHGVGKVKVLKKLELDLGLLNGLGDSESVSDQLEKSVMEFIQLLCYSGKKYQSFVDTRVRLYKSMKVKSSSTLLPGPKSLNQHIRRVNF